MEGLEGRGFRGSRGGGGGEEPKTNNLQLTVFSIWNLELNAQGQFLQLRYRLMPYFYTLSWEATQKGYPPVRPVFWADPTDRALWNVDDAFLLGDGLIVAPVLAEGGRSRQITLPKGRWYNFWDDRAIEGSGQVTLEAPLEQVPLLVKAGTILPMTETTHLTLHLYPPVAGSSTAVVYNDAGDGNGAWRLDQFHLSRDDQGLDLTLEQKGEFAFPYTRIEVRSHGMKLQQAWIDGTAVELSGNWVESSSPFTQLRLEGQFGESGTV